MAIVACKDCKAEISTDAKNCPKCGAINSAAYKGVRVGGLIYLGLIALAFYWIWGAMTPDRDASKDSVDAAAGAIAGKPTVGYTITQDDFREGRPRKVEVTLPRRLSEAELAEVAQTIRDDSEFDADRTFIGFRVEGQSDSSYWANASFDPDYRSSLIGLSAEAYQRLTTLDLSTYSPRVGSWLRDGALGHVMVLYTKDGKYFIDSLFEDGGKSTEQYLAKQLPDGGLRLELPENDHNEHYVVQPDGTLQGWGENGVYMTLPPMAVGVASGNEKGNG